MKKRVLFSLLFFLMLFNGKAQKEFDVTLYPGRSLNEQIADSIQYVFSNFLEGIISTKSDGPVKAMLNFNRLSGEFQFLDKNKMRLSFANPENVNDIILNGRRFVYLNNLFYEEIKSGEVSLLSIPRIKILTKGDNVGYGQKSQTSSVRRVTRIDSDNGFYYISKEQDVAIIDETMFFLRKGRKVKEIVGCNTFKRIFEKNDAQSIDLFVKENVVDFKNERDLVRLLIFCNGMSK